jgi:hypothetical protein
MSGAMVHRGPDASGIAPGRRNGRRTNVPPLHKLKAARRRLGGCSIDHRIGGCRRSDFVVLPTRPSLRAAGGRRSRHRGGPPAIQDLVAGQIDLVYYNPDPLPLMTRARVNCGGHIQFRSHEPKSATNTARNVAAVPSALTAQSIQNCQSGVCT